MSVPSTKDDPNQYKHNPAVEARLKLWKAPRCTQGPDGSLRMIPEKQTRYLDPSTKKVLRCRAVTSERSGPPSDAGTREVREDIFSDMPQTSECAGSPPTSGRHRTGWSSGPGPSWGQSRDTSGAPRGHVPTSGFFSRPPSNAPDQPWGGSSLKYAGTTDLGYNPGKVSFIDNPKAIHGVYQPPPSYASCVSSANSQSTLIPAPATQSSAAAQRTFILLGQTIDHDVGRVWSTWADTGPTNPANSSVNAISVQSPSMDILERLKVFNVNGNLPSEQIDGIDTSRTVVTDRPMSDEDCSNVQSVLPYRITGFSKFPNCGIDVPDNHNDLYIPVSAYQPGGYPTSTGCSHGFSDIEQASMNDPNFQEWYGRSRRRVSFRPSPVSYRSSDNPQSSSGGSNTNTNRSCFSSALKSVGSMLSTANSYMSNVCSTGTSAEAARRSAQHTLANGLANASTTPSNLSSASRSMLSNAKPMISDLYSKTSSAASDACSAAEYSARHSLANGLEAVSRFFASPSSNTRQSR
ncbi:hypothetical protein I302_104079 [Kwoniella bestiolae CBS 10118]|uniref:Uncharacterized protein n=1 Tax=Kwoniella bestiolae CBS 10118 TaxID=1296100 RepID=A0A1B9GA83_9TREE|nr:hypothetical protein I302_02784 [Kwoniella bestiolae CBS 10118]OCF27934.1 hypothetical protein I302_02784 [Kwoniella bestiolae CBS 10118]